MRRKTEEPDEGRRALLAQTLRIAALAAMPVRCLQPSVQEDRLRFQPEKNIIPAPVDPALWPAFRQRLTLWRDETRRRLNYVDTLYHRPEFAWAASSYCCCFLIMCDEAFYDRRTRRYTVDALLEAGIREFGGYNSVVLWHAYPRIGVDQRNQFDFYRDMPGGLESVREVVHTFQRRGMRVYIDYNPWDRGTRREGRPDVDVLVDMVRALDVDGIFLDTMTEGAAEFRAKLDTARPGVVLEGEGVLPLERIADHHASWAQHFDDSEVPGILRHKWLERRHMQHQIRRWKYDHTGELHSAWMNGSGMMVWENVFGSWVGWNSRDRSLLRAMLPIQRRYTALLSGQSWTPLVNTGHPGVYATLWGDGDLRLWTLVNRTEKAVEGLLLTVDTWPGQHFFDLIVGTELKSRAGGQQFLWHAEIPARGLGCLLAARIASLGKDFPAFLARQAATRACADYSTTRPLRETRLAPVPPMMRRKAPPPGMVVVRPRPSETLTMRMRVRECGFYDSNTPGEEGFWDSYRYHTREFIRTVKLRSFAIDETPVTNAAFAEFMRAVDYGPVEAANFLRHWSEGRPPAGQEDHPVVWVDLDDARAYAKWAGKRLPTEEEWQYAAQGGDNREYPWGSEMRDDCCNRGWSGGTTPVKAFPAGRSPFGCYDLCGNVWQWTESERSDGRTRFCIIRGGSYFSAQGSNWYVDGGPRPANFATKFLLMSPSLDRCATIGFRCAVDLE